MPSTKCCAKTARPDSLRRAGVLLLLLTLLGGGALTQEASQEQTQEASPQATLRSQANVVLIPALVKDQQGGAVYGLQAKDVHR
jgi:hypothetical protein